MKNDIIDLQLQYIRENKELLDTDSLSSIVESITENKLQAIIGFYPKESRFFGRSLFDFSKSLEWNTDRFNQWLKKNYDGNKELFLEYANNNSLFWHYYFRTNSDKILIHGSHYTISEIQYSASNLFYFLRGVILKVYDKDYTEATKLRDQFKAAGYNMNYIHILNNKNECVQKIHVKSYKNGRLDIKGLTPGQELYIKNLITNKKNSHVNPNWDNQWGYNYFYINTESYY